MADAKRVVLSLGARADVLAALAAFLVLWFHFWSARGNGTGRAAVTASPWRFWGPPALVLALILLACWFARRRPDLPTWVRSFWTGLVVAIPVWLFALVPSLLASGLIRRNWSLLGFEGSPEAWFAAYRHTHVGMTGEGLALMAVVAGPLALGMLVPVVSAIQAGLRRPPATLAPVVSGAATAATVLVAVAFAAFVVPALSAVERVRTTDPTEARRIASSEQGSANESLWLAIRMRDHGAVERMLYHGQSPDVVDSRGDTALIMAADLCDDFMVEALLRHGASVAHKDPSGRDALAHAIGSHEFSPCPQTIVALSRGGALPQRDALCIRLVEAAATGDTRIVASLAQLADRNGMKDVVAIGYDSAVRSGQKACAKTLAAYGPLPPATSCGATDPATTGAR